jgi:hypothetical protein
MHTEIWWRMFWKTSTWKTEKEMDLSDIGCENGRCLELAQYGIQLQYCCCVIRLSQSLS